MSRALISVVPPGEKGTTSVTLRDPVIEALLPAPHWVMLSATKRALQPYEK